MKPYPNEELERMSKREIIRLYKRTVEQVNDAVPVRHGKWIRLGQKHDGGYLWIRCSVCGNEDIDSPVCMTNYCPNCGARMDGERKEE